MTTSPRDVAVQVHIADPWASVPLRLMEAECGLGPVARLVLIYLLDLGRRPGWTIYASQARRALGLTEGRWKRVRRELEAAGYFVKHRGHAESGDWLWTYHIFDTPRACGVDVSIGAKRTDAKRIGAKQAVRHNSTLSSSTQRKKKEAAGAPRALAHAAPATQAPDAAATEKSEGQKQKRQQRVVHGVTCWTPEDLQLVAELTSVNGREAVKVKAGGMRAAGIDPLPSIVAKALQEDARAALQAEAVRKAVEQELTRRKARAAEQAERAARREDPEARARITALITETARRVGGYRS